MLAIEAVPTVFDGIQFQSRLEARFAQWLKDQNLEYEYHPQRIGQNQYQPDFLIPANPILVEVKPVCFAEEFERDMLELHSDVSLCCLPLIGVDQWRSGWHIWYFSHQARGALLPFCSDGTYPPLVTWFNHAVDKCLAVRFPEAPVPWGCSDD